MWHLLGKFSACSFCGSVFGAFGWGCFAQAIASRYLGRDEGFTQQQRFRHLAESYYWLVPWLIGYGVEVLCMSVCMIMVADRLVCHVGRSYKLSDKTIRRISLSFFALVVVLCSAGLVANVAVGVYNAQTAVKFSQAADACLPGGNSTARSGESLARSLRRVSFFHVQIRRIIRSGVRDLQHRQLHSFVSKLV
jgi:hypothetical protein